MSPTSESATGATPGQTGYKTHVRRATRSNCVAGLAEAVKGRPEALKQVVAACHRDLGRRALLGRPLLTPATRFLTSAFLDAAQNSDVPRFNALMAANAHVVVAQAGVPLVALCAYWQFTEGVRSLVAAGLSTAASVDLLLCLPAESEARVVEILQCLIASGADVTGKDGARTPLHHAVYGGSVRVVECLLAAGARVNARDADGRTPISLAESGWGKTQEKAIVDLLLHAGAVLLATGDVNVNSPEHREDVTPLHCAATSASLTSAKSSAGA